MPIRGVLGEAAGVGQDGEPAVITQQHTQVRDARSRTTGSLVATGPNVYLPAAPLQFLQHPGVVGKAGEPPCITVPSLGAWPLRSSRFPAQEAVTGRGGE